jgi:phosphoglycerol transferase MdoB-like AlkP superfamily enzyme
VRFWRGGAIEGLALALAPVTIPGFSRRTLQALPLAGLALLAWTLAVNTAIMDWNFMFQKLTACVVWVLSFAYLYARSERRLNAPDRRMTFLFWVAMAVPCYRLSAASAAVHAEVGSALERYAGYDASFRLIRDAISAPPRDNTFYKLLALHTNIPRTTPTSPVDVDPAGALSPSPGAKPNIFVIVIDSLRRDYLGAFNSAINFTPAIDEFARQSTVFRNAFTRYGGTGLAEPSIWVGGMLLHKQYVTPFYPMNALAKLVEAEKYRSYVSVDPILRVILKPTPNLVELDANRGNTEYRLCSSLEELEGKLENRPASAQPVFAYTQPQDIHISVINREKNGAIDSADYGRFYAPYASRVRRIDGCFGNFVRFLKARGMFDNSVIVLTADHGDSLGEEGRWGHAYALVPEVVRVPLIVHLPKTYQALYSAPNTVAFQSDITPSLYYLLGHKPVLREEFYGRPLFTESETEQKPRESYLIAASYAAVWGIVGDYGKSLYVADAVNYRDSYFQMGDTGSSNSGYVGASQKEAGEALIRKGIEGINKFYRFAAH